MTRDEQKKIFQWLSYETVKHMGIQLSFFMQKDIDALLNIYDNQKEKDCRKAVIEWSNR